MKFKVEKTNIAKLLVKQKKETVLIVKSTVKAGPGIIPKRPA